MFRDAFTKLDTLETEALLKEVNPLIDGSPYAPDKSTVLAMDLSFYPGARFLEIADHSSAPPRKTSVILRAGTAIILDWTNRPIYRLNETVPILLHEKNIIDYVRFFFSFVRGRHGRFIVIESVDDIAWKDEPPPNARKAIGSLIEPVTVTAIDSDGTFSLSIRMIFKDSLFKSDVRISAKGVVTMENEELVVEDIPVIDDLFR